MKTRCRLLCDDLDCGAEFFGDGLASYQNLSISCFLTQCILNYAKDGKCPPDFYARQFSKKIQYIGQLTMDYEHKQHLQVSVIKKSKKDRMVVIYMSNTINTGHILNCKMVHKNAQSQKANGGQK